jgi:drug/metabolite transporter (DMT)-like permease
MSEPSPEASDSRRFIPRLDPPTIAGLVAGIVGYLVVVFALGQLELGVGIAIVLLLAGSLLRTIRQTRTAGQRLRDGDRPEDQR